MGMIMPDLGIMVKARALTAEEQKRLFAAAASNQEWEHVYCAAIVAANSSMRPLEVKHLRRCDVDLVRTLLFVRRSKNESSHRVIPLNASALHALARMFERADMLGHTEPEHYLWPACQWGRFDATKPMLKWDTAWRALRDAAALQRLRFHDLRHTAITEQAEMGVADHVLESITGHLSRRMLEHYSHIRIDAKRQALDALDVQRGRVLPEAGNGNGGAPEIDAIIEVPESVTSQSRHSLTLSGSPPHGKLLIPLNGEMSEWLKEHAWKLNPLARADAHQIPPTHFRSTTSRNNDLLQRVPVNNGVVPGFRGVCDTVLTQNGSPLRPTITNTHRRVLIVQGIRAPWARSPRGTGTPRRVRHRDR
jgi:hypothetical protein